MKRIVWLGIGVAVGVYAYSRSGKSHVSTPRQGYQKKPNTSRAMLLAE